MKDREKAILELQKLIKSRRADIDPGVLEKAKRAAAAKMKAPKKAASPPGLPPGSVPYDRETAQKAVRLFLESHPEQKSFSKKLLELLSRDTSIH